MQKNPYRQYCLIDDKYSAKFYGFDDDGAQLFQLHEEGPVFTIPEDVSVKIIRPVTLVTEPAVISYEQAVKHYETVKKMREDARPVSGDDTI